MIDPMFSKSSECFSPDTSDSLVLWKDNVLNANDEDIAAYCTRKAIPKERVSAVCSAISPDLEEIIIPTVQKLCHMWPYAQLVVDSLTNPHRDSREQRPVFVTNVATRVMLAHPGDDNTWDVLGFDYRTTLYSPGVPDPFCEGRTLPIPNWDLVLGSVTAYQSVPLNAPQKYVDNYRRLEYHPNHKQRCTDRPTSNTRIQTLLDWSCKYVFWNADDRPVQ